MQSVEVILIAALTLVVGAAAVYLVRRRSVGASDKEGGALATQIGELTGRIAQMSEDGRKSQAELAKTLDERLDKVSDRMGKSLEASAVKTSKSIGEIEARLKAFGELSTELSGELIGLQGILGNKQARGAFGETQLNDLIVDNLPSNAYKLQATLSNGKRVDCLITLPKPHGSISIDAKFPLESFRRLRAAETDADKKEARRGFSADILKHVNDISDKYIIAGETTESALMFIPSEAVYAELHANFLEVVEKSYKLRVYFVSPNTLMAMLQTIKAVLRDVKMREQAGLIQKEVGALLKDVIRLDNRVDKLSTHFDRAERDIRDIRTSTNKITRHTERISDVQLEDTGDGDPEKIGLGSPPPAIESTTDSD